MIQVERTLRIVIGYQSIDEGQGLLLLLKVLHMQAEMYKQMGLWPLALGLYLDCADMYVGLMGIGDAGTIAAFGLVVSCLRKMQCNEQASEYLASLCGKLRKDVMGPEKKAAIGNIIAYDRYVQYWIVKLGLAC
jgi:hypothetical protein